MHCVNYFNTLINALSMHPGPSKRRVGGSYPGPHDVWGGPPVKYRKLETLESK